MTHHILIVEDEHEVAISVAKFLAASDFTSDHIDDGAEVEPYLLNNQPDLIVLDVMLPNKNGIDICRSIREQSDIPIIMLTACINESERLDGLEVGADDYVCKPFSAPELVMRIKAIIRRIYGDNMQSGLIFVKDTYNVQYGQNTVNLTQSEHGLLKLLHDNQGKICSRNDILDNIYQDYRVVTDRTVDSHVRNLRKKLKVLCPEHELVQAVYGAGYRFIKFEQK